MHLLCRRFLAFAVTISLLLAVASAQSTDSKDSSPAVHSQTEIVDLQKKAEAGDSSSAYALGRAYENGDGVRKNLERAAFWYRKAAEQGNAKAQNSLGVLYWIGEGVDRDKAQAVRWYRKAARQGDASAMFNMGAAYYNGEGVNENVTLACAWFLISSEAGSAAGQDALKRSQAEKICSPSDAYLAIGEFYESGEDLPQNLPMAESWYRKAAQGPGSSEAQVKLAVLLLTAKEYDEALPRCKAAAKEGRSGGYFCLGYLYQHGLGVHQDLKAAFRAYEQGARANPPAMYALSQMYKNGQGTRMDRAEAAFWLIAAASHGYKDAADEARKLRQTLTAQEWKATERKLQQHNFNMTAVENMLQARNTGPAQ